MKDLILFKGKRIDNGDYVTGMYFIAPLTDENSGTNPDAGWFFLTGETRHCISTNLGKGGVVYVVEPESVEVVNIEVACMNYQVRKGMYNHEDGTR